MHPYEISVLGEEFLIFPHSTLPDIRNALEYGRRCVILQPSLFADLRIVGYESCGKPLSDYRSAAVSAAAHLREKSGLPLSEISIETPNETIEIRCTGAGYYALKVDKCKVLLPLDVEFLGCEPDVCDVSVNAVVRVLTVSSAEHFDARALPRVVSLALPLPDAVAVYSRSEDTLFLRSYADHKPTPPSSVSVCAAAAFREYERVRRDAKELRVGFTDGSFCRVCCSFVDVWVKPILFT